MKVMRNRYAALALAALLATVLAVPAAANDVPPDECVQCGEDFSVDLIAGGGNSKSALDVGEVFVSNCESTMCVQFQLGDAEIAEGWVITETHVEVATSLGGIPQTKKGNPIPGAFEDIQDHDPGVTDYKYCVSFEDIGVDVGPGDEVFIAAHAVVELPEISHVERRSFCIGSDADTLYWNGADWVSSAFAWVHPSWNSNLSIPLYNDAEWIWEDGPVSPQEGRVYVDSPIMGDIIEFMRGFMVEGTPVSGSLAITTDNGYEFGVNGTTVGSAQLSGDWRTSDLTQPFCDRDNWQSVEVWDITPYLAEGANTLAITGVNEYMGPLDGDANGTPTSNPGGLIYKMCVDSDVTVIDRPYREETAWGDGEDFPGANWATYFTYTIQYCPTDEQFPEGGTMSVAFEDLPLASGNDWDYNDFVVDIDTVGTFVGPQLTDMSFTIRPQAKLAGYTHVMHMAANAFGCDGTYELYHGGSLVESGVYDDSLGIDVITVPNTGAFNDAVLVISFDPGCAFAFPAWDDSLYHGESLFFDPYIVVNNTGEEIHTGDPRMLTVPTDWSWPTPDGNAIWNVYTNVTAGNPPTFVPNWWMP